MKTTSALIGEASDEVTEESGIRHRVRFGGLVGRSAPMQALFSTLEKAAVSNTTVLLEGETGTGKDTTAEAIHRASARRGGPFIVVDCGAIPPQLLESELFGSERGAFTGAVAARGGAFEAASGGTIFLDEIGELHLDLQPKLLRAIERHHVKRVGATDYRPVDLRVIAATNRSLRVEVEQKRFREDLYYRLAVVRIKLPPMRERMGDFPLLVEEMLVTLGVAQTREADGFREAAFTERLAKFAWPGNIRQLRNHIERCVALGDPHLSPSTDSRPPPGAVPGPVVDTSEPLRQAREQWMNLFERAYLETILAQHDDSVASAARAAGIDRIHFYRLLWKHGIREHKAPSGSEG